MVPKFCQVLDDRWPGHEGIIHGEYSASGSSNGTFALERDFLFEALLFGGDFGLRLQPVLDRLAFGTARVLSDVVSPLADPLFMPPAFHFILLLL